MKIFIRTAFYMAMLAVCSGCAHTGSNDLEGRSNGGHRTRNILIAVGAAVVAVAILANRAESNIGDAIDGVGQD